MLYTVCTFKGQLESKGLLTPDWIEHYGTNPVRVYQSFDKIEQAQELYKALSHTKGVAVTRNWLT